MDGKCLRDLISFKNQPALWEKATSIDSKRLLSTNNLTLEELIQIRDLNIHLSFPDDLRRASNIYLMARIAIVALNSLTFNQYEAEIFLECINFLRNNEPWYKFERDTDEFMGRIFASFLKIDDVSEMKKIYEILLKFKDEGHLDNYKISESKSDLSHSVQIEKTDESKICKKFEFSVSCPNPILCNAGTPFLTEELVTDKSQLQLEQYPFHSNTNNSVHMHIYKGIFPYSDTHQFPVAVKEYHANYREELCTFMDSEYKILSFLSGKMDCFLYCYGNYVMQQNSRYIFGIVMEYCETNLMQFIEQRLQYNAPLEEQDLNKIVNTLLEGFGMMHKNKIYHYDVKPHNIFLTKENVPKIADFNVSKIFDSELFMTTLPALQRSLQGTDGYMPPEIQAYMDAKRMGEDIGPLQYRASKVDVYSLGLTFLQLHTLKSVYGLNRQQNQDVLMKTLDSIDILWFKNLLENMLVFDFNQRQPMKRLFYLLPQIDVLTIYEY